MDAAERLSRFVLSVMVGGKLATYCLPERGSLSLGRAAHNDIVLDDPSVSRRHIAIHIGELIEVEDLGSSNGTRVRAQHARHDPAGPEDTGETRTYQLEPRTRTPILPGDAVHVGGALFVVRPRSGAPLAAPDPMESALVTAERLVEPESTSQSFGLVPAALKTQIARAERERIVYALDQCSGNQTQAARLLGISRRTLIARLDAYGFPRPRKKMLSG